MTLFEVLFLAHLVGDFLFQTSWMAMNKSRQWLPLLTHVTVYTATLFIASLLWSGPSLTWPAVALIFISHVILDKRIFVAWWVRNIQMTEGKEAGWLGIVADQIFHLLIIGIAVSLTLS